MAMIQFPCATLFAVHSSYLDVLNWKIYVRVETTIIHCIWIWVHRDFSVYDSYLVWQRMLRSHALSFELAAQLELKPYNFVCITAEIRQWRAVAVVVAMASHRVKSQLRRRAYNTLLCFVVVVSFAVVSSRATLSLESARKMHKSCSAYAVSIVHISIIFVRHSCCCASHAYTRKDSL